MAITLAKDTWKLPMDRKMAIWTMLFSGIVLLFIIVSSFVQLYDYDYKTIEQILIDKGLPHTSDHINAYVRLRAIMTIIGNTLVMGFFSGLIWWASRGKRFGYIFGAFWLTIFGVNAISLPFYSVDTNVFAIISSILNAFLAVFMIAWIIQLMHFRTRLKQEIARKRG